MKTPEEIKKGLECCSTTDAGDCEVCPYKHYRLCGQVKNVDALAYIRQLETGIDRCYEYAHEIAAAVNTAKQNIELARTLNAGLAGNLKLLRKYRNLTQAQLAERANISTSSIINYENDRRADPPATIVIRLAKALGVTVEALMAEVQEGLNEIH